LRVLVGTCGFQRARGVHYSSLDVLEVQQTFYDPRDLSLFSRWRSEAPSSFVFTVKAWMLVSHEPGRLWSKLKGPVPGDRGGYGGLRLSNENVWAWGETLKAVEVLGSPIVVVQTPPSFGYSEANLDAVVKFFTSIDRRGRLIVWEPRGSWWGYPGALETAAREAGILIDGDLLRGRMPPRDQDIIYTRLHGLGGGEVNYRYRYSDSDLERLAGVIEDLSPKEAYVLFNNVYSYDDAVRFKAVIGRRL
jgi:Uncharacterized conserved protein